MRAAPLVLGFALLCSSAQAGTIAACGPQKGQSYFPAAGLVSKSDSGWQTDQISGGATTLTLSDKGDFDVLFKDSRGTITSATGDGGKVVLLRLSHLEVTVLVYYPEGAQAAEIYSFVRESDGSAKMLQLASKGLSVPGSIAKAGVYVADCSALNLP